MHHQYSFRPLPWSILLLRKTPQPQIDRVLEAHRRSAVRRALSRKTRFAFRVRVFLPRRRTQDFAESRQWFRDNGPIAVGWSWEAPAGNCALCSQRVLLMLDRAFACWGLSLRRCPGCRRVEWPGKPGHLAQCLLLWRRSKDLLMLRLWVFQSRLRRFECRRCWWVRRGLPVNHSAEAATFHGPLLNARVAEHCRWWWLERLGLWMWSRQSRRNIWPAFRVQPLGCACS